MAISVLKSIALQSCVCVFVCVCVCTLGLTCSRCCHDTRQRAQGKNEGKIRKHLSHWIWIQTHWGLHFTSSSAVREHTYTQVTHPPTLRPASFRTELVDHQLYNTVITLELNAAWVENWKQISFHTTCDVRVIFYRKTIFCVSITHS